MSLEEVFPPDFLEALQNLRVQARRVAPGGPHGEHHARQAGSGIEFRDYRAYVPGDDFRRIDWNLFARFERLYLRLLDELKELPVHLLLDLSDSAWAEDPPRSLAARRIAGIWSAVGLNQLDPVGVFPFGADLGEPLEPRGGKRRLPEVLRHIAALEKHGRTDIRKSLESFGRLPLRRGLAIVISDFFDPGGVPAIEAAISALRHRVVLVRLVRPSDFDPTIDGEVRLTDAETGEEIVVAIDDPVIARYRESHEAFSEGLRTLAHARGCPLLEVDVTAPLLPQFSVLFEGGVFSP